LAEKANPPNPKKNIGKISKPKRYNQNFTILEACAKSFLSYMFTLNLSIGDTLPQINLEVSQTIR